MKDHQKVIQNAIAHATKGGKFILKQRCQGKPMKEIDVQQLIDMNYRVLILLGYATSIVGDYKRWGGNEKQCKWFYDAVQAVVYENKPLPPMP